MVTAYNQQKEQAATGCCFGRYLATILTIPLLISTNTIAAKCKDYVPPKGEKIEVKIEAGSAEILLPSKIGDDSLKHLVLFVYLKINGKGEELALPLAFSIDDGIAKSNFGLSSLWGELELFASYSGNYCGPRLEYKFPNNQQP
jgi:hypothetical protein